MVISLLSDGGVRLSSGETAILVDPSSNRAKGVFTLRTQAPAGVSVFPEGEVSYPGEYEIQEIDIHGIQSNESDSKIIKTAYLVHFEGVAITIVPELKSLPDGAVLSEIEEPDVLLVPVGGKNSLSGELAEKLVRRTEPSVVIPIPTGSLAEFFKAMGVKPDEASDKFTFKAKDLKPKEQRIVHLAV
jgi:L-ascorbate metabolism protein UlaG (beta-lactamase superfamily)